MFIQRSLIMELFPLPLSLSLYLPAVKRETESGLCVLLFLLMFYQQFVSTRITLLFIFPTIHTSGFFSPILPHCCSLPIHSIPLYFPPPLLSFSSLYLSSNYNVCVFAPQRIYNQRPSYSATQVQASVTITPSLLLFPPLQFLRPF